MEQIKVFRRQIDTGGIILMQKIDILGYEKHSYNKMTIRVNI